MLFWEFNSLSKILSFSEKQVEDHWERLKSAGLDLLSNARLEKIVRSGGIIIIIIIIKILFVATSYQSHITKLKTIFTKIFTVMYNILFTRDIYIKGWVDM